MMIELSMLLASASLGYMAAKSRLGQRKSREPSDRSKLHLPPLGFFRLLRNLRPAMRAGPDLGGLYIKLGCKCYFGNDVVIQPWYGSAKRRHETDQTWMHPPASEMTAQPSNGASAP